MSTTPVAPKLSSLKRKAFAAVLLFMLALFVIFWVMSGTIFYWEAWIYIIAFSAFEIVQIRFLIRNDPELVRQRLTLREETATQQKLIWFGGFNYLLMYALPAIDRRYGWSMKPIWLIIVGYFILGIGWAITYKTFQTNRWAGRTIQVQKDQKVINTGLYGVVRHPLYLGGWVISIATPLTLGSYWGLIASLSWLIMLIMRLLDEEKMLKRDLPDYEDYCKKIKYRLIPGIFQLADLTTIHKVKDVLLEMGFKIESEKEISNFSPPV